MGVCSGCHGNSSLSGGIDGVDAAESMLFPDAGRDMDPVEGGPDIVEHDVTCCIVSCCGMPHVSRLSIMIIRADRGEQTPKEGSVGMPGGGAPSRMHGHMQRSDTAVGRQ